MITTRPEITAPLNATILRPTPQAMPMARARKINTRSIVSRIAVRKRMILMAPTRPNARAMLLPTTMMTMAEMMLNSTSELTNVTE